MLSLAIINGPNLNLLGTREVNIYGNQPFEDFYKQLQERFSGVSLSYFQSNVEGELINYLQECRHHNQGIILNAAAYTHTSIGIADAIAAIETPVMEVHISNVLGREDFRKTSFIAAKCIGSISGLGLEGYALAIQYFIQKSASETA